VKRLCAGVCSLGRVGFHSAGEYPGRISSATLFNFSQSVPNDAFRHFRGHEVVKGLGVLVAKLGRDFIGEVLGFFF
jgi:hypothetical protein